MTALAEAAPAVEPPSALPAARDGRCFLCGRRTDERVLFEGGYDLVRCRCGLAFVQPVPDEGRVDPLHDAHPASFYALPARRKLRWLRRHHPGGRLVEIGCGEGAFLDEARRFGFEVRGVEPHAGRARIARTRGIPVEERLLEQLDGDGPRADVVFHTDLLSHFPEPAEALVRMLRLLAPGGSIACEVGLLGDVDGAWLARIGGVGLPQHRWLYSQRALERLFASAGLAIVAQRTFGLGPAVLVGQAQRALVRAAAALVRRAKGGRSAVEVQSSRPSTKSERSSTERQDASLNTRLRDVVSVASARVDDSLRYGVGLFARGPGPATAFVLARPVAADGDGR